MCESRQSPNSRPLSFGDPEGFCHPSPLPLSPHPSFHQMGCWSTALPAGGGGSTPLYKLYRYVTPQSVWFLSRFGLKTGIDFDHYGLKSGMVFKGTTGAYERICIFNSNGIVKIEKYPKYIIQAEFYQFLTWLLK